MRLDMNVWCHVSSVTYSCSRLTHMRLDMNVWCHSVA